MPSSLSHDLMIAIPVLVASFGALAVLLVESVWPQPSVILVTGVAARDETAPRKQAANDGITLGSLIVAIAGLVVNRGLFHSGGTIFGGALYADGFTYLSSLL